EVLVQLVMAAMTIEPLRTRWVGRAMTAVAGARPPATSAAPPSKSNRATSSLAGFSSTAKAEAKLSHTDVSDPRYRVRFGSAAVRTPTFPHRPREVPRGDATRQGPGHADADHDWCGQVGTLRQQRGLRRDAADAPAEPAQAEGHPGMTVGAEPRVGKRVAA